MKTQSDKKTYTIKDLADASGVPTSTINHYLNVELLKERERAENNYRLFGEEELKRLLQITELRMAGFSIEQIKKKLPEAKPPV